MARIARIVVPGVPHHVTQRGNRDLETFFSKADYKAYIGLLAESCAAAGTQVWAYCLLLNQVQLILVPSHDDGLRAALGEAHRRYTRRINEREGWRGHLWQERFHSFAMDEGHLAACVRYVELSPLREKLVRRTRDWRWSSARAHLKGRDDGLCSAAPLLKRYPDWPAFLKQGVTKEELEQLRAHGRSGRPLGGKRFLDRLEAATRRSLRPGKRGRPKKAAAKTG